MTQPRKIAVLTVGRSDFSRYRPVLKALRDLPQIQLRLLATGGHFSPTFGDSWREITESGFSFEPGLESMLASDSAASVGKAIGLGTLSLAQSFAADRPDLLVVLGDRYEMLSGVSAALGFGLPVVHIHGGAVTEGAIDELVRHALTKMSHLHLVSTEEYAQRVRQMGEEAWRVQVVGAPGLDELPDLASLSRAELSQRFGLDLSGPFILFSYHPVTLELKDLDAQIDSALAALNATGLPVVLTYPNADSGHQTIITKLEAYAVAHGDRAVTVANAGGNAYVSLMAHAAAMMGNSSSGLVESPSFKLPVVNIGTRQDGKIKPANVIDTGDGGESVAQGLTTALDPAFRRGLADLVNPYGDGRAGQRIAAILADLDISPRLLRKKFIDL